MCTLNQGLLELLMGSDRHVLVNFVQHVLENLSVSLTSPVLPVCMRRCHYSPDVMSLQESLNSLVNSVAGSIIKVFGGPAQRSQASETLEIA